MVTPPYTFDTGAWLERGSTRPPSATTPRTDGALAWCYSQHVARHGVIPGPGGRNAWLTAFTKFCNERGVAEEDLQAYATHLAAHDFTAVEIKRTVHGIYTRDRAHHARKPYVAATTEYLNQSMQGTLTPAPPPGGIPAETYRKLPIWLRKCCEQFSEGPERDVMLLGTLTVLSGCFPSVKGIYDGAPVWLNLFSFVLAPAASGKGALAWARKLAWPWHQQLTTASKQAYDAYLVQQQEWKASRKGKHANSDPPPPAPPFRQLYIPANNTASALMKALSDNDGRGIICETEADTLSGALGQDFGNFSDLLRKAFHHEPVSLMRKTDREQIDITSPAISIALTGTPAQLRRLIPTAEDGLFSRFLFYTFERPAMWRDVSPAGGRGNLETFFDEQAKAVTRMMAATAASGNSTIQLTATGWALINAAGNAGLAAVEESGSDGAGLVFRLGLTTFRLAGILALLRCFEDGVEPSAIIEANDHDVQAAIQITNVCRAHALFLLDTMPAAPIRSKDKSFTAKADLQALVLEMLAQDMSYREIEEKTGVSKSTIGNWRTKASP